MRHHAMYKKPLSGKVIFIDLASNFQGLQALQDKLKILGAELESCFSKEVDYLITNKEYAKPLNLGTSPSNTSPGGTPSPFGLAKGSVDSNTDNSPAAGDRRPSSERLSRGQKLLNARRKKSFASIVENAIKWEIKIISYESAMKYIERELKNMPDSVRHAASSKQSKTYERRKKKVNVLKGAFVKFEAASRHYRPVHQEFAHMPELHLNSRSCPFDKNKGQGAVPQEERAERGNEGDTAEDTPGESRNSKASEPKPAEKGKKLARKSSVEVTGHPTKIYTPGELRNIMRDKAQAEAKKGYCEICRVPYDDIKKHQWNAQHREFVTNTENFRGLDSMIESGPNFEQFLNDVAKYHAEHVKEGLAESEMDDEVLLIKEGLPESSDKQDSRSTPPPPLKRKSKFSPKKRLFAGSKEGGVKTTGVGSKLPETITPVRRKVIPKRITSSSQNKTGASNVLSGEKKDTQIQALPSKSTCTSKTASPRQPRASPRQLKGFPRLPRQSPRKAAQRLNASVCTPKDCSPKNQDVSSSKRSRLSLRKVGSPSGNHGATYNPSDVEGCSKSAENDAGLNCNLTLRDITKDIEAMQTVVNTVLIDQNVDLRKNCHVYNTKTCDNIPLDKTKVVGDAENVNNNITRDKKVVSRHCRRADKTPSGTDFQDSGINVSNSSPVKDPQEEAKVQEVTIQRKSSRKSRSRMQENIIENNRKSVDIVRGSINEQEGRGDDMKDKEINVDENKRRKSCPVFSAKRRLLVSVNDEKKGESSVEKRSRKDEKRQRSLQTEDRQNVLSSSSQTVINTRNFNKCSEGIVEDCRGTEKPVNVLESRNSVECLKNKERTEQIAKKRKLVRNNSKPGIEKVSIGIDTVERNEEFENEVNIPSNAVTNAQSKTEPVIVAEKSNAKARPGKMAESPLKVGKNKDKNFLGNVSIEKRQSKKDVKDNSARLVENNNVSSQITAKQKTGKVVQSKETGTKGNKGDVSPRKKGVKMSEEVTKKGKIKDQQSPEEKEALKKKKKIKKKLRESWQVLSDRSMRKLFESEGDPEFEGYTTESFHEANLPLDVSYIDLTEVEYSDNSEVEWIFCEAQEGHSPKHLPPIHNFLKKQEVSGERASSHWNEPVDFYVSSHVEREETERMTHRAGLGSQGKWKDSDLKNPLTDVQLAERTMEKTVVEESKGNPKHMLKRVFSRYLSGGGLEPLWVDSSEPSEREEGNYEGIPDTEECTVTQDINENNNEKISPDAKPEEIKAKSKSVRQRRSGKQLPRSPVMVTQSSDVEATTSLIVNMSQCESPDIRSPEIPFIGIGNSNVTVTVGANNLSDALSPEIPFIGKVGAKPVDRLGDGLRRLTEMQEQEFDGIMHSTPLHKAGNNEHSINDKQASGELQMINNNPRSIQPLTSAQRQISIPISDTTVEVNPRFSRRSLASIFELNANSIQVNKTRSPRKKGPRSIASVQTIESVSPWKVSNDMDGQIEVDEEIIFNYNSPQKLNREFSPLKDRDIAYLRRLNSSQNASGLDHSRRNLSGVLLSQAGLQIDTILSKSKNAQDNESETSEEIPFVGSTHKKFVQSPVIEELKSKAMYKFDYMSAKRNKAKLSQRKWYSERVNRSRKLLSGSTKNLNKENCTPSPEQKSLSRLRNENRIQKNQEKLQSPRRKRRKLEEDDKLSSKGGSECRVNIMLKKFRKRGCLCHEHKPGSKCPNARENKKLQSSPDYKRKSPLKRVSPRKSPLKRARSNSPLKRPCKKQGESSSPGKSGLKGRQRSPRKSECKNVIDFKENSSSKFNREDSKNNGRMKSSSPCKKVHTPLKYRSTSDAVNDTARNVSPTKGQRQTDSKRHRSVSGSGKSPPRKRTREDLGSLTHEHYLKKRLMIHSPPQGSMKRNRLRSGSSTVMGGSYRSRRQIESPSKIFNSKSMPQDKKFVSPKRSPVSKPTTVQKISNDNQNKSSGSSFMLQRLKLQVTDEDVCASFMPVRTRSVSSISSEDQGLRLGDFLPVGDNSSRSSSLTPVNKNNQVSTCAKRTVSENRSRSQRKLACPKSMGDLKNQRTLGENGQISRSVELRRPKSHTQECKEIAVSSKSSLNFSSRKKLFSKSLKGRLRNQVMVALSPLSDSVATRLQTQGHIVTHS